MSDDENTPIVGEIGDNEVGEHPDDPVFLDELEGEDEAAPESPHSDAPRDSLPLEVEGESASVDILTTSVWPIEGESIFTDMPEELIAETLFRLDIQEILYLVTVSQQWCRLIGSSEMWKRLFVRHFGEPGTLSSHFFTYLQTELATSWKWITLQVMKLSKELDAYFVDSSSMFAGEFPRHCRIVTFFQKWSLNETTSTIMKFTPSVYVWYGYGTLLFDQIKDEITALAPGEDLEPLEANSRLTDQPDSPLLRERYANQWVIDAILGCTMPLSGQCFPARLRSKAQVSFAIERLSKWATSHGYNCSDENLYSLLSHVVQYLDPEDEKERDLIAEYQQRSIETIKSLEPHVRVKYYNLACVYSMFKMFEECEENMRWAFNYKDGEYREHWISSGVEITTKALIESARFYDEDFDNVRDFPWFEEILQEAALSLPAEEVYLEEVRIIRECISVHFPNLVTQEAQFRALVDTTEVQVDVVACLFLEQVGVKPPPPATDAIDRMSDFLKATSDFPADIDPSDLPSLYKTASTVLGAARGEEYTQLVADKTRVGTLLAGMVGANVTIQTTEVVQELLEVCKKGILLSSQFIATFKTYQSDLETIIEEIEIQREEQAKQDAEQAEKEEKEEKERQEDLEAQDEIEEEVLSETTTRPQDHVEGKDDESSESGCVVM